MVVILLLGFGSVNYMLYRMEKILRNSIECHAEKMADLYWADREHKEGK